MKFYTLLFCAFLVFTQCVFHNNTEDKQKHNPTEHAVKDGVFIHITQSYNNPHKVLMPMKMATLMAIDKDVLVYLDIDAVKLLTKTSKDLAFEGFDSFKTYLNRLIERGVHVCVCPSCLKAAGIAKEQLIDGVVLASKDKFFNFTKGRIITFDY